MTGHGVKKWDNIHYHPLRRKLKTRAFVGTLGFDKTAEEKPIHCFMLDQLTRDLSPQLKDTYTCESLVTRDWSMSVDNVHSQQMSCTTDLAVGIVSSRPHVIGLEVGLYLQMAFYLWMGWLISWMIS